MHELAGDLRTMIESRSPSDWISALDAVHMLSPALGGDVAAKSTLVSRLTDGVLPGRASTIIEEADIGKLDFDDFEWGERRSPYKHDEQIGRGYVRVAKDDSNALEVPADFMQSSEGWVLDTSEISWPDGLFIARRPARLRSMIAKNIVPGKLCRRAVGGLELRKMDVLQIIGGNGSMSQQAGPRPKKAGGRPRVSSWDDWVAELVAMIHEDGVPPSTTAPALIGRVRERLADRGKPYPEDETVMRVTYAVINRFRELVDNR